MKFIKLTIFAMFILCFILFSCSEHDSVKPGVYPVDDVLFQKSFPSYGLSITVMIDSIEIYDDYSFEVFCSWICSGDKIDNGPYLIIDDEYDTNYFYILDENLLRYDHKNRLLGATRGCSLYPGETAMGSYRFDKLPAHCSKITIYNSELGASKAIWF